MNTAGTPSTTRRPAVASVAKAAAVLQAFSPLTTSLTVRQLADRTGIPRSTVHALCSTLCDAGLLENLSGHGYQLGATLVTLGGHVIDRTGLVSAAERPLAELRLVAGYELHLAQLVQSWVVYLDRRTGEGAAPMRNRGSLRALAHRTGCGRAALSMLPEPDRRGRIEDGCRREGVTPPDEDEMRSSLEQAHATGFVVTTDARPGRTSVAAAVLDAREQPIGGVSIAASSETMSESVIRRLAPRVVRLAADISRRLVDGR